MIYNYIFLRTYAVAKLISYDVPEYKAMIFYSLLLTLNFIELANILFMSLKLQIKFPLLIYLIVFVIILIINYNHFVKNDNYKEIKKKLIFNNKIKIIILDFVVIFYVGLSTILLFAVSEIG